MSIDSIRSCLALCTTQLRVFVHMPKPSKTNSSEGICYTARLSFFTVCTQGLEGWIQILIRQACASQVIDGKEIISPCLFIRDKNGLGSPTVMGCLLVSLSGQGDLLWRRSLCLSLCWQINPRHTWFPLIWFSH